MKFLVLGIGNVMFCDEGVGVHLTSLLQNNYKFKSDIHSIDFIDGGTLANALTPIIASYDEVLIIDCIDADNSNIGDVFFFNYEDMPKSVNFSGSAHEVEMLQTLCMMDLLGDRPNTFILGIVPKRVVPLGFEISDEIKDGVKLMKKTALKYISNLGFEITKIDDKDIQEIADEFKKSRY